MRLKRRRIANAGCDGEPLVLLLSASVPRAQGQQEPAAPPAQAAQDDKADAGESTALAWRDAIADFKQNNPDWYDVNRPSRSCRTSRTSSARTAIST